MTYNEGQTLKSTEADVFLIASYVYVNSNINKGSINISKYYQEEWWIH